MSKITFIGDVMLGRFVAERYEQTGYNPVEQGLIDQIRRSDYVIANLESAVKPKYGDTAKDHLSFLAPKELLAKFSWIDCFSTANNHINDGGDAGIAATISVLDELGLEGNGIFTKDYKPYIIKFGSSKIAIITLTDMMNTEISKDSIYHVLRMGDDRVTDTIKEYKAQGYLVILYAHVGILFTRFPNPITYDYLHKCIDDGCDAIITAHSHCVGGWEDYNGKLIFHSLGDFVMDGNSFRRRRSSYVTLEIENNKIVGKNIAFAEIDKNLTVRMVEDKIAAKLYKSVEYVRTQIVKHSNYRKFFKKQYRMEILQHSLSTIHFLIKDRGITGLLKTVFVRSGETKRMMKWVSSDSSNKQRDDDALTDRIDTTKI